MDNASGEVLNRKCHQFEQLYHGSVNGEKYCLGNNVAKEYMCPLVSDGRIAEMPLNKWFSKQAKCRDGQCECHQKMPLLGKYHLCPNQSNYSHYQEAPFQRGQFYPRVSGEKPVAGQPDLQQTMPVQSNRVPQGQKGVPQGQKGGYVFTSCGKSDPYHNYPGQQGYFVKRCVGERTLNPSRYQTDVSFNQPIPSAPSKPPVPPLARKMMIESTTAPMAQSGPDVSISGWSPAMNNLIVGTPGEQTNRFIMESNIAPGYYPDMVQDHIGKRPVYTARNLESDVPEIILKSRNNLAGHDAGCHQPNWSPKCV
jgi:hypothetical protein